MSIFKILDPIIFTLYGTILILLGAFVLFCISVAIYNLFDTIRKGKKRSNISPPKTFKRRIDI